jgi:Flp pilus assembly protein TadG
MRRALQRGSAAVEAALIALPLVFITLAAFELGRAMWLYHSLAAAVRTAARYAVVHGEDCVKANAACAVSVGDVVGVIQANGAGLDPGHLELTFTAGQTVVSCATAAACASRADQWPPPAANAVGQTVSISARYGFHSVLSVFWPGQDSAIIQYVTRATEVIQF